MPEPLSPFRRLVIAEPGTVRIEVRRGGGEPSLWAVIDIEDWELVGQYTWSAEPNPWTTYATASVRVDGKERGVFLHRLLMNPPDNMVVDHIDHNGLNNRRANLRIATQKQNAHNRKAVRGSTSKYKGVSRNGRGWTASIGAGETREYLGSYATEEEAARVFDWRSRQLYGEFALLNFPDDLRETPPVFQRRMADRQVYGLTANGHEITRYGPGGRYYVENDGRKLRWVTMREAARLIAAGQWNSGIPGGSFIDAEVRRARSKAS